MVDTNLAQKTGLLIALSRLLIAVLMVLLSVTDPQDASMRPKLQDPDDALAFAYLAGAIAQFGLFHASWVWTYRLRRMSVLFDCAFYLGIMVWIEPMDSGYFAATFAMLTFMVISINLQWNWRYGLAMLVGANLVCLIMVLHMHLQSMAMNELVLIRRQAFLFALSLFLILTSLRFRNLAIRRLSAGVDRDEVNRMLDALNYAMAQIGARGGAICWVAVGQPSCPGPTLGTLKQRAGQCDSCNGEIALPLGHAAMFNLGARFSVEVDQNRQTRMIAFDLIDRDFIGRFEAETGILVPLNGATGRGRLLLTDIPFQSVEQLHLAQYVGSEIEYHMDVAGFHRTSEQLALANLRQSIACDLHDSVVQSMAGVRYWLSSAKAELEENHNATKQIDKIAATLAEEQNSIRAIVEDLRSSELAGHPENLIDSLRNAAHMLENLWRIKITINAEKPVSVGQPQAHELVQIVREAVSNAVRHGSASAVQVSVAKKQNRIEMKIIDNGRGMAMDKHETIPWSLSQRVRQFGGSITVTSKPGNTAITVLAWAGEIGK